MTTHVMPRELTVRSMTAGQTDWQYISVTDHHRLDREEAACQADPQYNFLACVKASQAREVGCRPAWDIWSPGDLPACTLTEQLSQHELMDHRNLQLERKIVLARSGCLAPCRYREYRAVGGLQKYSTLNLSQDLSGSLTSFLVLQCCLLSYVSDFPCSG